MLSSSTSSTSSSSSRSTSMQNLEAIVLKLSELWPIWFSSKRCGNTHTDTMISPLYSSEILYKCHLFNLIGNFICTSETTIDIRWKVSRTLYVILFDNCFFLELLFAKSLALICSLDLLLRLKHKMYYNFLYNMIGLEVPSKIEVLCLYYFIFFFFEGTHHYIVCLV